VAVVGWEWIVIIAVVLVFLLWGPQKIPELARAIGEARREFDKASRESQELVSEVLQPAKPSPPANEDQTVMEIARRLGLETEGKTRTQLLNEILQTLSKAAD